MSAVSTELWQRLADYDIGPSSVSLSFAQRLARENRWRHDFTARVIREYKRFCYLAVTTGHQVTPSDAVDQAWHLHLTYSRDYWERFCPQVLGGPLHHGPTAGGTDERNRFYEQYAATLKSYEEAFGETPPGDIWPDARRRFVSDPKAFRVNPDDVMILSHKSLIIAAMAGSLIFVGALLFAGSG